LSITVRLLCGAHRLSLEGAHGAGQQPDELHRWQNWIGGTPPGNAAFVPPPPDQAPALLIGKALNTGLDATRTPR
jgi:hypothetical protein